LKVIVLAVPLNSELVEISSRPAMKVFDALVAELVK